MTSKALGVLVDGLTRATFDGVAGRFIKEKNRYQGNEDGHLLHTGSPLPLYG